jgi:hypothetical protein
MLYNIYLVQNNFIFPVFPIDQHIFMEGKRRVSKWQKKVRKVGQWKSAWHKRSLKAWEYLQLQDGNWTLGKKGPKEFQSKIIKK